MLLPLRHEHRPFQSGPAGLVLENAVLVTWQCSRLLVHMVSNVCPASEVTFLRSRLYSQVGWPYRPKFQHLSISK